MKKIVQLFTKYTSSVCSWVITVHNYILHNSPYIFCSFLTVSPDKRLDLVKGKAKRMTEALDTVSFHGTTLLPSLLVAGFHGFLYPPSSHATSTVSSAIFSTLPIQGASLRHSVNKAPRWPTSSEVRSQSPFSGSSCGYTDKRYSQWQHTTTF